MVLNSVKKAGAASGQQAGVSNGLCEERPARRRGGACIHSKMGNAAPVPAPGRLAGNSSVNGVTEEDVARERARLLVERQTQLDKVLNRHDDLIREKFHLDHFVTLLEFNPVVAKRDDSIVFQEYKAKYDLVEQVAATAGPSRTTRRAHNQRILDITAQSESPTKQGEKSSPSTSHSVAASAPPTAAASAKSKGKEKMAHIGNGTVYRPANKSQFSRPGTHEKMHPPQTSQVHPNSSDVVLSSDAPLSEVPSSRTSLDPLPFPDPLSPNSLSTPTHEDSEAGLLSTPTRLKRRLDSSMTASSSPVPCKKHKSITSAEPSSAHPRRIGRHESASGVVVSQYTSSTSASMPKTERTLRSARPSGLPATSSIKRVRLIVRRPPPSYTNPKQRPPPPQFRSSLEAFLRSYTTVNDRDQTEENLQALAMHEAILRNRIDKLDKLGRFFPYSESSSGMSQDGTAVGSGNGVSGSNSINITKKPLLPVQPQRPKDAWDYVVEAVVQRNRRGLPKGRQVAAQVASRIQGYWDQHASREKTARAQEERRLRALAKATIKMVTNEWKRAVFYIREQERLRAEAEEKRRGHEHLDAILDQSGQILETQQSALSNSEMRSRSTSISMDYEWEESSDEQEDGSEQGTQSGEEFGEVEQDQSVVEDEDNVVGDGSEGSDSESSDEGDESTRALLGMGSRDEGDDIPESPVAKGLDIDSADESVRSTRAPSELNTEDGMGLDVFPDETEGGELAQEPSEVDSVMQTPTMHESCSPVPATSRDYTTSPESSAMVLDAPHATVSVPSMDTSRQTSPGTQASGASGLHAESEQIADDAEEEDAASPLPGPHSNDLPTSARSISKEGTPQPQSLQDDGADDSYSGVIARIPAYLRPFAVAPVDWLAEDKVKPPVLLRGVLRPYQQSGLEWLASLHSNNLNGILADEMGLGKTIQTISLLAHLACDRGIWGPHLIIVPTSVLLNWEMEFKKFLPGFKILSYHGTTKRRKELRQGWYNKYQFNVCITSYALASRDAHIFKRKTWYYMILDEAHMIKNFKSQRWNILLMFRSFRRLLLTGTPLQNNLTELWALLQFLMSGTDFANLKEFGEWFSNPLEKAIEMGTVLDDENLQRVSKLHTVLRPYLLRRLKRDVEKELPSKYEHLVLCPLSKRQRFLYDEFMARAHTREALQSGVYQKIANILMQLRKVCNHPDLFEVRPVVTSFAMPRSAIADYEIKELLIRRKLLHEDNENRVNLDLFGFHFIDQQATPLLSALETRRLNTGSRLPFTSEVLGDPPPKDTRTIEGHRRYRAYCLQAQQVARWIQIGYVNGLRCSRTPIYGHEMLRTVRQCHRNILPLSALDLKTSYLDTVTTPNAMVISYEERARNLSDVIEKFAFVPPAAVALDLPRLAQPGCQNVIACCPPEFDRVLHQTSVKLQIAFPDPSLLQYDCGKLQELSRLLRQKKAEGHRVLIFTQMTRVLDILEIFLNFHGYLYLRLDGATKIEDRQYITERFNADARVFCFISSSRSGGVGINLTGADTVIFYDSDFNPQMDRQCEDRAHRIGQIRDVHIYRFISSHTVEEAMLMKANQKRSLDEIVIQKGEFDWRTIFEDDGALTNALGEFEDTEDAHAAAVAAREEDVLEGANQADFGAEDVDIADAPETLRREEAEPLEQGELDEDHGDEDGGTTVDYMISFVRLDYEFFRDWRL